jgi:hypothetical protein
MAVRLASSDCRELAASSKTLGAEARLGPQEPTSLAALVIAARSETLRDSIVATLVAAWCSVTAWAGEEAVGEAAGDAVPDAVAGPVVAVGLVPVLAVSRRGGWLNGCAISSAAAAQPPSKITSRMIHRVRGVPERSRSCRRGG